MNSPLGKKVVPVVAPAKPYVPHRAPTKTKNIYVDKDGRWFTSDTVPTATPTHPIPLNEIELDY